MRVRPVNDDGATFVVVWRKNNITKGLILQESTSPLDIKVSADSSI